jgi:hypothetical protein
MRSACVAIAACLSCISVPAYGLPPIGFERWTEPPPGFGVSYNLELDVVSAAFGSSSATFWLQMLYPDITVFTPVYRVIDIEIHDAPGPFSFTKPERADIVYIPNSGAFERDTWVLYGLTLDELKDWATHPELVLLDIERYSHGSKTLWAAVLLLNPINTKSMLMTDATLADILEASADNTMRPLDVDRVGQVVEPRCLDHGPPGQACPWDALYDAVLVDNRDYNRMDWHLKEGWDHLPHVPPDAQLVDIAAGAQFSTGNYFAAYLSVAVDRYWMEHDGLTSTEVNQTFTYNHERIVDLDLDPDFDNPFDASKPWPYFHTVSLP